MWSANVSLTWEIIKGLIFRTAATYNTTNNRIDKFYKEGSKKHSVMVKSLMETPKWDVIYVGPILTS